jgi:peptidoglycan/LPS O-acetylase OafA/YrhL
VTRTPTGFLPAVESVRGIAAFAVSGLHSYLYWIHFRAPREPHNPLPNPYDGGRLYEVVRDFFIGAGTSAVTLFFVISGFVLLLSLNKGRETTAVNFAAARAFRIYPAHMAVVLAWFLLGPWMFFGDAGHSFWDLAQNLTLAFGNNYVPMNGPTWSLRVEIAAIPLILLAWFIRTSLGARGLAFLAAILAGLSFARGLYFQDMIGRYLFVFALGMLIPDLIRPLAKLPRFVVTSIVCAAIAVDIAARPLLGYHSQASILIEALCCTAALALIVGADSSFLTRFLHYRAVGHFDAFLTAIS